MVCGEVVAELGVAELVCRACLTEYTAAVCVFEKALRAPWQATGQWEPQACEQQPATPCRERYAQQSD